MSNHTATAASDSSYNYHVVRQFTVMTIVWGIFGMGIGVLIASQLVWPELNDLLQPYTHFGRLRPLHTNAVFLPLVVAPCLQPHIMWFNNLSQVKLFGSWLVPFTFGVGRR